MTDVHQSGWAEPMLLPAEQQAADRHWNKLALWGREMMDLHFTCFCVGKQWYVGTDAYIVTTATHAHWWCLDDQLQVTNQAKVTAAISVQFMNSTGCTDKTSLQFYRSFWMKYKVWRHNTTGWVILRSNISERKSSECLLCHNETTEKFGQLWMNGKM